MQVTTLFRDEPTAAPAVDVVVPVHPTFEPGLARQLWSFAFVGLPSTAAYALFFVLLRPLAPMPVANAVALLVTAVANTAANAVATAARFALLRTLIFERRRRFAQVTKESV